MICICTAVSVEYQNAHDMLDDTPAVQNGKGVKSQNQNRAFPSKIVSKVSRPSCKAPFLHALLELACALPYRRSSNVDEGEALM